MENCNLPKVKLMDLIDNVVFKVSDKLEKDNKINYEFLSKFKIALTKLAIILLLPDKEKIKVFKTNGISLQNLNVVNEKISRELLSYFMQLHSEWTLKNCGNNDDSFNEDEFFDFDSEEIDENINDMHYKDIDKIDATTFMNQYGIDDELKAELNDLLIEVNEFIYDYEDIDLNQDFLDKLKFLQSFIKTFEFSGEFMDIGYALEMLREKLENLEISVLKIEQKNFLKLMILSILQDLSKWIEEVIIKQTAKDIHYLDASLLANIAQIDIMLKSFENKDEDEDELELF